MAVTTIQVRPQTKDLLAKLKATSRETYDEVLNKLLTLVPDRDEEGIFTQAFRVGLLQSRLDIRKGRVVTHDQVRRRLGL